MEPPEILFVKPRVLSAESIARAMWAVVKSDEGEPRQINIGVVVGSESACMPMVDQVATCLYEVMAGVIESHDIGLLEVVAHRLKPGKWTVVARFYT